MVVIGRGLTIGRPLALLLALKRPGCNAAVTVVHTGVPDLADHVRRGDIVVAAAGSAGLVTADMIKPGAAQVVGHLPRGDGLGGHAEDLGHDGAQVAVGEAAGKQPEDAQGCEQGVDAGVAEVAGWITPRLGGVGPMTRAMLLRNALAAAERS